MKKAATVRAWQDGHLRCSFSVRKFKALNYSSTNIVTCTMSMLCAARYDVISSFNSSIWMLASSTVATLAPTATQPQPHNNRDQDKSTAQRKNVQAEMRRVCCFSTPTCSVQQELDSPLVHQVDHRLQELVVRVDVFVHVLLVLLVVIVVVVVAVGIVVYVQFIDHVSCARRPAVSYFVIF